MQAYWQRLSTPVGTCTVVEQEGHISHLYFGEQDMGEMLYISTPLLTETVRQLNAYFDGRLTHFDLPLLPVGTEFQQKCWQVLQKIPYGQVLTYGQQAQMIGKPGAARAVGMANHHNPMPILIPCHRIIGSNGSLTGYAGGLWRKQWLLQLEKRMLTASHKE